MVAFVEIYCILDSNHAILDTVGYRNLLTAVAWMFLCIVNMSRHFYEPKPLCVQCYWWLHWLA